MLKGLERLNDPESTDLDLFNSIIIFSLKTVLSKSSGLGDKTWGGCKLTRRFTNAHKDRHCVSH